MTPDRPAQAADIVPALVTLHVWGVPARQVPAAMAAVVADRPALHRCAGLTFAKLLGTADGRTFAVRDADVTHWAVLACWSDERAAAAFERSAVVARWNRRSADVAAGGERLAVRMRPLASRGSWSGRHPFGDPDGGSVGGPVAAVTRARLRLRTTVTFWRAVPAVSARLVTSPGLLLALGLGDAPVRTQGTFSMWASARALDQFAYRSGEHREVIRRTAVVGWYTEELFARFAVLSAEGSLAGRPAGVRSLS